MGTGCDIVITGAGIVSAIGIGKGETLRSLLEERTGIAPLRHLRHGPADVIAGEVKMSDEQMKRHLGITSEPTTRTSLLGMMALEEALTEAALLPASAATHPRTALISGTTVGGMDKSERFYTHFLADDSRNDYILTHDCGSTTELIARHFAPPVCPAGKPSLFSIVTTPSTACSSAANAIVTGANLLRSGLADVAVAGGAECLSRFHLSGFSSLMIVDHRQCRPFDADRAGLNLGEGAAFLVMESAEHAKKRKASAMARLSGYGNACDAFHQTASSDDGEGAYLAMRKALLMAGLRPQDIGYVNAHGTATPNNDASESRALVRLFSPTLPPISSTKGFTGHTTSASGSVEAVVCLLALQHSMLPASYGFRTPMPDGIVPVAHTVNGHKLRHVMCNSFGFGGNDTSIILSSL